jgi:hypothetical protein
MPNRLSHDQAVVLLDAINALDRRRTTIQQEYRANAMYGRISGKYDQINTDVTYWRHELFVVMD